MHAMRPALADWRLRFHIGNPDTDLLTVNGEFTAAVVLSRCRIAPSGTRRWLIRLDEGLTPDITVAVRLR